MHKRTIVVGIALALACTASANAQGEQGDWSGPAATISFQGGGLSTSSTSCAAIGASLLVDLNRWIAIEGEGGWAVGELSALAQPREHMPRYDPAAEVTIAGTVTEVTMHQMNDMRGPGSQSPGAADRGARGGMREMTGTHLTLDTGDEVIEVHVGPSHFIESEGFALAAGDEIEVVGSRMRIEDTEAIVARTLKKGQATLSLRDEQGAPRWSQRRGRH